VAVVHPRHADLLAAIQRTGGPRRQGNDHNDSYGSSGHPFYRVPVPVRREIARTWLAGDRTRPTAEILAVTESLFAGDSHEEKTLAALLLGYHRATRNRTGPADVERWLDHLNGWAEIDTLCYGIYTAPELLAGWADWENLLRRLSHAPDPNRRRAALVLLTKPIHACDDERLRELAVEIVDRQHGDRNPLVTKAVSWLLRSMVTHHRDAVAGYLAANEATLAAIVVRETRTKLATGTKRGRA
jgi:3-methyladenine DNA glycosylase AlkD